MVVKRSDRTRWGMNLYEYCGNDCINTKDSFGCSRVIITNISGKKKVVQNPSLSEFRKTIQGFDDNFIASLTIYDHGGVNNMDINGDDDGCHVNDIGKVVFDDIGTSVAELLRPKMTSGGTVYLSGCFTAYEGIFNSTGMNIAKSLSSELPGVKVTGNKGTAIGNKIGPTWNFGIRRTYVNGKAK